MLQDLFLFSKKMASLPETKIKSDLIIKGSKINSIQRPHVSHRFMDTLKTIKVSFQFSDGFGLTDVQPEKWVQHTELILILKYPQKFLSITQFENQKFGFQLTESITYLKPLTPSLFCD